MTARSRIRLELEVQAAAGVLRVSPRFESDRGVQLRYELVSEKSAGTSRSTTRQAGSALANPGRATVLSTLKLSLAAGERHTISFRLYEGDTLVAERVLVYPPAD